MIGASYGASKGFFPDWLRQTSYGLSKVFFSDWLGWDRMRIFPGIVFLFTFREYWMFPWPSGVIFLSF